MEQFDLDRWLKDHGHTQASLARAMDVSRWTLKRIKDKGQAPRQFVLACRALESMFDQTRAKAD